MLKLLRILLIPFSYIFYIIVTVRNWLFDSGIFKEKKVKDDKLRELEQRRVEEGEKEELIILDVASTRIERKAPKILDKERKVEEKALSEEIFSLLDEAESLANIYKQEIKSKGILNVNCPYERVIKLYKQAQEKFKEIGWMEQASKINNSIQFYKEKLDLDKKLRLLEEEKLRKQEEEMIKQQIRVKISEELENEMKLQREKALELKQKEMLEYESKKEQAFNLIDLAKEKLEKNQFDEAIRYYNESKEIFAEISWAEGIRMINESIRIIKTKREEYEREIKKLEEKGIAAYLPLQKVYRKWSDRYKQIETPLLNGYVFVHIALKNRMPVLRTDGIVRIVSFNGIPAPIPDEQINTIKIVLRETDDIQKIDYLTPGKKVEVTQGCFKGIRGVLTEVNKNHRLVLRLDCIKQAISVNVDYRDVEPVKDEIVESIF